MFLAPWHDLLRVLVVGTAAYAGLILVLRITGKRTLSKMNAFDLVVTVALGSTLATVLLSKDIALVEGLLALTLLCLLQFVIAFVSVRWPAFRAVIKAEPTLLLFKGAYLRTSMRRERVSEEEILAALRSQGIARADGVGAVVLETDGSFSVVPALAPAGDSTLRTVAVRQT